MSAHEVVDFCDARMRLRASRAAIVFPGDEGWHDWARLALYTASQLWGGKGFVLVPHTGGDVDPMVLRAVTAYDPDYVVQLQVTLSEYEALRPGALSISSAGRVLAGTERAVELERNSDELVPHDAGTAQARATVAAACAPYRQRLLRDGDPSESTEWISSAAAERQFTSVRDLSAPEHWPYLAAPPTWSGALGVAVAARGGMVEPPKRGVATPVEGGEQSRLARWLLDPSMNVDLPYDLARHGGAAATSVRPIDCPPGFDRTTTGLTWITHRAELHPPALVMIGDTAADFAVSMIWDRIYGDGYWLPSVLGNDDLPAMAQRLLLTLVQRSRLRGRKVRVMSRSIAAEAVLAIVEALRAPPAATEDRTGASERYAETVVSEPIEFPRGSTGHWASSTTGTSPSACPSSAMEEGARRCSHHPLRRSSRRHRCRRWHHWRGRSILTSQRRRCRLCGPSSQERCRRPMSWPATRGCGSASRASATSPTASIRARRFVSCRAARPAAAADARDVGVGSIDRAGTGPDHPAVR